MFQQADLIYPFKLLSLYFKGNINITGFQIVERENREFALLNRQIELAIKELNEKPDLDLEVI